MATTTITETTSTVLTSGAEPDVQRRRRVQVVSQRVAALTPGVVVDFAKALSDAAAPSSAMIRVVVDDARPVKMVCEWETSPEAAP